MDLCYNNEEFSHKHMPLDLTQNKQKAAELEQALDAKNRSEKRLTAEDYEKKLDQLQEIKDREAAEAETMEKDAQTLLEIEKELEIDPTAETEKTLSPKEKFKQDFAKADPFVKSMLIVQRMFGTFMAFFESIKDSLLSVGSNQLKEMAGIMGHMSPKIAKFLNEVANSEKGLLTEEMSRNGYAIVKDPNKNTDKNALDEIQGAYNTRLETKREVVGQKKDAAALEAFRRIPPVIVPAGAPPPPPAIPPAPVDRATIAPAELKQEYSFKTFLNETLLSKTDARMQTAREEKWGKIPAVNGKIPVSMTDIAELLREPRPAPVPDPAAPPPVE